MVQDSSNGKEQDRVQKNHIFSSSYKKQILPLHSLGLTYFNPTQQFTDYIEQVL